MIIVRFDIDKTRPTELDATIRQLKIAAPREGVAAIPTNVDVLFNADIDYLNYLKGEIDKAIEAKTLDKKEEV